MKRRHCSVQLAVDNGNTALILKIACIVLNKYKYDMLTSWCSAPKFTSKLASFSDWHSCTRAAPRILRWGFVPLLFQMWGYKQANITKKSTPYKNTSVTVCELETNKKHRTEKWSMHGASKPGVQKTMFFKLGLFYVFFGFLGLSLESQK